jgi:hypothetical protein
MKYRRAEFEDGNEFNNLVRNLGGPTIFRAWFGQCNFLSVVEYSSTSIIAINEEDGNKALGFLALNDSISNVELQKFPLDSLSSILNCKVSKHFILYRHTLYWFFCRKQIHCL